MKTKLSILILALAVGVGMAYAAQQLQFQGDPQVTNITNNSATITWVTNAPASSMVLYGTNQAAIQSAGDIAWNGKPNAKPSGTTPGLQEVPWGESNHTVTLSGLQPGTTYYLRVRSSAGKGTGGMTTSNVVTFATK